MAQGSGAPAPPVATAEAPQFSAVYPPPPPWYKHYTSPPADPFVSAASEPPEEADRPALDPALPGILSLRPPPILVGRYVVFGEERIMPTGWPPASAAPTAAAAAATAAAASDGTADDKPVLPEAAVTATATTATTTTTTTTAAAGHAHALAPPPPPSAIREALHDVLKDYMTILYGLRDPVSRPASAAAQVHTLLPRMQQRLAAAHAAINAYRPFQAADALGLWLERQVASRTALANDLHGVCDRAEAALAAALSMSTAAAAAAAAATMEAPSAPTSAGTAVHGDDHGSGDADTAMAVDSAPLRGTDAEAKPLPSPPMPPQPAAKPTPQQRYLLEQRALLAWAEQAP
ncbi:hypothetical protein CXG81DRAFT_19512 [Caulochytrium protostelioides]|uniref:Mediator of RNA polymerase II transcription subunit 7 n=1 Tax=Caulochytrium protostelioides TaxID=1555241 RepID=A0A4V1IUH3_9FUNG|nr:hypothetical protein CXG81DRAFT_19512 [Caulochytrium protostelioides]|eukprot:RKP00559.1 hypothetical protein CXG81DRAFT_19512 [Caulochytrium protostelioides]